MSLSEQSKEIQSSTMFDDLKSGYHFLAHVNLNPKPEHKKDMLEAFNALEEVVRAENGCLEYVVYEKGDNLIMFERWDSKEAIVNHLSTPHMREYFEKSKDWYIKSGSTMDVFQCRKVN